MKGYVLIGFLLLGLCTLQAECDVPQRSISVPGFPQLTFDVRSVNAVARTAPIETGLQKSFDGFKSSFELAEASTRADVAESTTKIDMVELIYTVAINVLYGVLNYFTGNYIAIVFNVLNIIKALVLYFFGN